MKNLYVPKNHTPEQLLKILGYAPASRGFVIKRVDGNDGGLQQIHALIEGDAIDYHGDKLEDGKHVSTKSKTKLSSAENVFKCVDNFIPITGGSTKKHLKKFSYSTGIHDYIKINREKYFTETVYKFSISVFKLKIKAGKVIYFRLFGLTLVDNSDKQIFDIV
jgi:hypothetical protein